MRRLFLALILLLLSAALVFTEDGGHGNAANKSKQNDDHNNTAPVQSGYAVITPATGATAGLVLFETFGMRGQGDAGTIQAGVLPPDLTVNSVLFVDSSDRLAKNLGVAIVNPNSFAATVTLTLRKNDGTPVATTTVTVPPRQQIAKFVRNLFTAPIRIPAELTGTLAITSNLAVSVIGLRFRGSNFSTLPVTNLSGPAGVFPFLDTAHTVGGPGALLLPQFVANGGWATELVLMNAGTSSLTVRVDLFKSDGSPLSATLNGQTATQFTGLTIPASGVLTLAPRDQDGDDDF